MRTALERGFRKENTELKANLEFFNVKFDEMSAHCKQLEEEDSVLKERNESLSTECSQLKKQVSDSEQRVVSLEQCSRKRNIEIKGVPFEEKERLPDILDKIGNLIREPITPTDVEVCYRVR